jgi:hypothetical protein
MIFLYFVQSALNTPTCRLKLIVIIIIIIIIAMNKTVYCVDGGVIKHDLSRIHVSHVSLIVNHYCVTAGTSSLL